MPMSVSTHSAGLSAEAIRPQARSTWAWRRRSADHSAEPTIAAHSSRGPLLTSVILPGRSSTPHMPGSSQTQQSRLRDPPGIATGHRRTPACLHPALGRSLPRRTASTTTACRLVALTITIYAEDVQMALMLQKPASAVLLMMMMIMTMDE